MALTDDDRALMRAAGYEVSPDCDQPGWFLWVRREHGKIEGGSDTSLPSQEEAEEEVMGIIREVVLSEAEDPISLDQWQAMDLAERLKIIETLFG